LDAIRRATSPFLQHGEKEIEKLWDAIERGLTEEDWPRVAQMLSAVALPALQDAKTIVQASQKYPDLASLLTAFSALAQLCSLLAQVTAGLSQCKYGTTTSEPSSTSTTPTS